MSPGRQFWWKIYRMPTGLENGKYFTRTTRLREWLEAGEWVFPYLLSGKGLGLPKDKVTEMIMKMFRKDTHKE